MDNLIEMDLPDEVLDVASETPAMAAVVRALLALAESFDKRASYGGALVWTQIRATVIDALKNLPVEEDMLVAYQGQMWSDTPVPGEDW